MKKPFCVILLLSSILLDISLSSADTPSIVPNFKRMKLVEFTKLSIAIMPDSGTQLIFPFALDNPELYPSLKIKLTNTDGFHVPTTNEELNILKGQNTLTITGLPADVSAPGGLPVFLGTLYVSIGGYNLTVALNTTYKPSDVVTNVIFDIDQVEREHMVEKAITRHTKMLDDAHQKKIEDLDNLAREHALQYVGEMALTDPEYTSFKIDGDLVIGNERLVVYADELVSFDDTYHVLLFDIENPTSRDISVFSWELSGQKESGSRKGNRVFTGQVKCRAILKSDSENRCSFSTLDRSILKMNSYSLRLTSDRGEGVYSW